MFGRALFAKGGAIVRLLHPLQDQTADAVGWLLGLDFLGIEEALGIVLAKLPTQLVAALGGPPSRAAAPANVQVLLLDGSWREATGMAQDVATWGRRVSLPMAGESRYWLRAQADGGRFSTVEALMFLLERFGLADVSEVLRLQFELHVYASLRSRGAKELAREFLATSPAAGALADFIAALDAPRPR